MSDRPLRILAFDPGLTCTGYALLGDGAGAGASGCIFDSGTMRSKETHLVPRLNEMAADVWAKVYENIDADLHVVIEFPGTRAMPPDKSSYGRRSVRFLPHYGMAVGVVFATVRHCSIAAVACEKRKAMFGIITTEPGDWTRGLPKTKGDPHKEGRVRLVESIYGLSAGAMGAKTVAGNVADAVLLARWGLNRVRAVENVRKEQ